MHPNIIGALVNSALYLISVFVTSLVTNNAYAGRMAIASMGISYVSHYLGLHLGLRAYATGAVAASIFTGVLAGALLVLR